MNPISVHDYQWSVNPNAQLFITDSRELRGLFNKAGRPSFFAVVPDIVERWKKPGDPEKWAKTFVKAFGDPAKVVLFGEAQKLRKGIPTATLGTLEMVEHAKARVEGPSAPTPGFQSLSETIFETAREAEEHPENVRTELDASYKKQHDKILQSLKGLPPDGLRRMRQELIEAAQKSQGSEKVSGPQLRLECLAAVKEKQIEWLWADRIPKGKLTIFSGNPDCGKTTVACDLIARFTTGREFPDGAPAVSKRDVLLLSAEDDPADTLKPRLVAAGADIHRVHILKSVSLPGKDGREREFNLDSDLDLLEAALTANSAIGLLIIDPITSYLGAKDLNKEQQVRQVLVPVKDLAEATGVTVIGIGHFSKRSDVSALHKVGGAVAVTGVARAVWLFTKSPDVDGEFQMLLGKGNLTKKRSGLRYTFGEKTISAKITSPFILWGEETTGDADSVFSMDSESKLSAKAERFLAEALEDGQPRPSEQLTREGKEQGLSQATLFRVRKEMGVKARKDGSRWVWQLEKAGNDPF